jgi:hypothetical protein
VPALPSWLADPLWDHSPRFCRRTTVPGRGNPGPDPVTASRAELDPSKYQGDLTISHNSSATSASRPGTAPPPTSTSAPT